VSENHHDAATHLLAGRILEDESLTADLVDVAASELLNWGVAQAEALARQAEALLPEEVNARLADLRRKLKRISKQASEAAPEAQVEQVQILLSKLGGEKEPEVDECYASSRDQ
jgi:glutamyl-tRNA reductase